MIARFIAFEGLEGTGKSTLARMVAGAIGATLIDTAGLGVGTLAKEVAPEQRPGGVLGAFASRSSARGRRGGISYERLQEATGAAIDALSRGKRVVIDGYWMSAAAIAPHSRWPGLPFAGGARIIAPEVTVVLDASNEVLSERLARRGARPPSDSHLLRVERARLRFAELGGLPMAGRTILIDTGELEPEAALGTILCRLVPQIIEA